MEPLLRFERRADGRGRSPRDARAVLNGVLWILRTGAQWRELPAKYPPYQTCHRRFQVSVTRTPCPMQFVGLVLQAVQASSVIDLPLIWQPLGQLANAQQRQVEQQLGEIKLRVHVAKKVKGLDFPTPSVDLDVAICYQLMRTPACTSRG